MSTEKEKLRKNLQDFCFVLRPDLKRRKGDEDHDRRVMEILLDEIVQGMIDVVYEEYRVETKRY